MSYLSCLLILTNSDHLNSRHIETKQDPAPNRWKITIPGNDAVAALREEKQIGGDDEMKQHSIIDPGKITAIYGAKRFILLYWMFPPALYEIIFLHRILL